MTLFRLIAAAIGETPWHPWPGLQYGSLIFSFYVSADCAQASCPDYSVGSPIAHFVHAVSPRGAGLSPTAVATSDGPAAIADDAGRSFAPTPSRHHLTGFQTLATA